MHNGERREGNAGGEGGGAWSSLVDVDGIASAGGDNAVE